MATKIFVRGSAVRCVYDDRFLPLLEALGDLAIERASSVEYDCISGEWFAMHISGQIIARGKNRNDVIAQEIKWLEEYSE